MDSDDRLTVAVSGGAIDVRVTGTGPLVVLVPSLGRGATDFDDLAGRLAAAGYRAASPEPRGIGATTAPTAGVTMGDLAADVAAVVRALGAEPAVLVGHAFGNRVVRMAATDHPDVVRAVGLLACGGVVPPSPEISRALNEVFDVTLSPEEHLDRVGAAFFAPGNDPSVWDDGWHPDVALRQGLANQAQPVDHWWAAGGEVPVLVVQPEDDVVAPPANAHDLVAQLGGRVTLVEVADAGHALLPEQPAAVATALVSWLDGLDRPASG